LTECFEEIFSKIKKWDKKTLEWARDWLSFPTEKEWNVVLSGCNLEPVRSSGKVYFRSKMDSDIYYRFERMKVRGSGDSDSLGAYVRHGDDFKLLRETEASYIEDTILRRLEYLRKN